MYAYITWGSYGSDVCLAKVKRKKDNFFEIEEEYFNCKKNFMYIEKMVCDILGEDYNYLNSHYHTHMMESYVTIITEEQKEAILELYNQQKSEYDKIASEPIKLHEVTIPVNEKLQVRYGVYIAIKEITGNQIRNEVSVPHILLEYIEKDGKKIEENTTWSIGYTMDGKVVMEKSGTFTMLDITKAQDLIDFIYKKTHSHSLLKYTSEYKVNFDAE